jgi:ribosomal protein S18 acetylase RimI-like enzyme
MNMTPERTDDAIRIETWKHDTASAQSGDIEMLAVLLRTCVCGGASISFVLPFSHEDAKTFWIEHVFPAVAAGTRCLLVARSSDTIIGTVQLDLATPPNQPHRAEVRKLLVHPDARRRGVAKALMNAVHVEARRLQRALLTLDTVTNGPAERLYQSLGYFPIGSIPRYAFNFDSSVLESATVMYKDLTRP